MELTREQEIFVENHLLERDKSFYRCSHCKRILKKGWSDEEQEKEKIQNFGNLDVPMCVVCDDCYYPIMTTCHPGFKFNK